jgi:hypothetical protein
MALEGIRTVETKDAIGNYGRCVLFSARNTLAALRAKGDIRLVRTGFKADAHGGGELESFIARCDAHE